MTTPKALDQGLNLKSILDRALSKGGELAELFFERVENTRVSIEDGKLDQVVEGTDQGVGVRILSQGKSVYGYTTELTQSAIEALAETLAASVPSGGKARTAQTDFRSPRAETTIATYRVAEPVRELPVLEKVRIAKQIDAGARAELPSAKQITAAWIDTQRDLVVVNSDGTRTTDQKVYFTLVCQVIGEKNGRTESAYEVESGFEGLEMLKRVPAKEVGAAAARQVAVLLDARPAPAGSLPVVISAEAGGTMVHEAVGHGLEADLACNNLSVYQNQIGQQVASPLITVIDDGTMPSKRGSYAFDDEGTPAKKTTLIENGVLKTYMVDRLSAMKFDLMSTGNGRRESFRHKPMVRMTNTYIAPGPHDPAEILRETPYGVFVKKLGGGQVNTVTGDFVFAITEGYLIRDGKIAEPIRGATLVGNGPKVLKEVDRVGTDLGFATGTCGKDGQGAPVTDAQPTMRIPSLTVGGETAASEIWPEHVPA